MTAVLTTYKVGDNNRWWTYSVTINEERVKTTPTMYRMYTHEKTAIRNGQRVMDAAIYKYINH